MTEQASPTEFLNSRPTTPKPMFTTPPSYTGWRYALKQGSLFAGVAAVAFATFPALVSSGSALAYPAMAGVGLAYVTVLTRLESLREGRPLGSWFLPRGKRIADNAGRTFLPEYAQYQAALDEVAREKQGKKMPSLRGRDRHPKGSPQGGQFR
jgi:hypothetical protein